MPENLPAKMEITALAEEFPIINPATAEETRGIISANIGAHGMTARRMDKIKIPQGAGTNWLVQSIDGEVPVKEMRGIVLAWSPGQVFYRVAFAERGKTRTLPDCASKDGLYGIGDPGGECRSCPMNQWASDPKGGRGKWCKEVVRILFLRADQILPEMITIPPTSLKNAQDYFWRLTSARILHWGLVTNLRLERTSNADGIDYARALFSGGPRFNEAEKAALTTFQAQMVQLLSNTEIDASDFESHDSQDDD